MSQRSRTNQPVQKQTYRRQILAGDVVRPSPDPWERGSGRFPMTMLQRNFLVVAVVLLLVAIVLLLLDLLLLATVPLFLLALVLITGRFVF